MDVILKVLFSCPHARVIYSKLRLFVEISDVENSEFRSKFERLYNEHYEMLYRSACKIIRDSENAREVIQVVFVELWENRHRWETIQSFKGYLLTSVFNRSINFLNKKKKIVTLSDQHHPEDHSTERHLQDIEFSEMITRAINQLPTKCREIFLLSREEGLSYQQIAKQLDISVKTVETQMGIAFKKLRQSLADYNNLPGIIYFLFF